MLAGNILIVEDSDPFFVASNSGFRYSPKVYCLVVGTRRTDGRGPKCILKGYGAWVGWGGMLTFMYLAYTRGCYAAATSLGMGGVGGDINVHVPCLHTWMLRCCYVTGHGWGGGDINVHVPCLHTWMLRCCEFLEHLEDLLPQD